MKKRSLTWTQAFFLLLLLSMVAKLPSLDDPLAEDEVVWAQVITSGDWEERFQRIPHPPLAMFFYVAISAIGLPLKLIPLLAATAGLAVLFFALRRMTDERTAFVASVAALLSPLFTVGSLQLDIDGGFILLGLAALFYITTIKDAKKRLLYLGILSGLMLLTKYSTPIFFVPFWIREMVVVHREKKYGMYILSGVLALGIFALFPLVSYLGKTNYFLIIMSHGTSNILNWSILQPSVIFLILQVVLLVGPFLLFFSLTGLQKWKKAMLPISTILLACFFYLFVVTSTGRPLERYLTPLVIPAAVLAIYGVPLVINKKFWQSFGITVFVLLLASILLPFKVIPFNNKFAYLKSGLLFLVPFRGSSGPFGFYIASLVLIVGGVALLWGLFRRKKEYLVPVAIMLGVVVLMNAEILFALTTPNVSLANELLEEPMEGLRAHRNFGLLEYGGTSFWDHELVDDSLATRGGHVTLLNFPPYDDTPLRLMLEDDCGSEKEVVSRGVLIGQRFTC